MFGIFYNGESIVLLNIIERYIYTQSSLEKVTILKNEAVNHISKVDHACQYLINLDEHG